MEFKSSYEETVVHARKQWDLMGNPEKPGIGTNRHSTNQGFQVSFHFLFFILRMVLEARHDVEPHLLCF